MAVITLQANKWLGVLTNLIGFAQMLDTIQTGSVSRLIRSAEDIPTPYGDGKVVYSANIPAVKDLDAENSTLLKATKPDVREQYLPVTDYKVVPLSINRYLVANVFCNETIMADFAAYVLVTMEKSRDVYLYQAILEQYVDYVPTQATQTLTVNLINTAVITTGAADVQAAKISNANTIVSALIKLLRSMEAPSNAYNDEKLTEIIDGSSLKLIINNDFDVDLIVNTFATLFGAGKITEEERWSETIGIPSEQLVNAGQSDTSKLIGWFGDRKKVQFGYFYEVATSFFDGSTLNENHFLHFSIYIGTVKSLPCVKILANFVAPANNVNVTSSGAGA